jgi:hypothetical protein
MPQQLQLFMEASSKPLSSPPNSLDESTSDSLLEQTRQLFQHSGSNSELMTQIMAAIKALDEICEQPKI